MKYILLDMLSELHSGLKLPSQINICQCLMWIYHRVVHKIDARLVQWSFNLIVPSSIIVDLIGLELHIINQSPEEE